MTDITADQLAAIFPDADADYLGKVAAELNTDLAGYGLDTALRKAHFFAQVRQEAGAGLEAQVESLNYNEHGLLTQFKYYKNHPSEAATDARQQDASGKVTRKADQETIANKVYASRLGNGDSASGDGWSFRGRGLIQVTGRDNYRATAQQYAKLYPGDAADFEKTPDLMTQFPYTVRSAVCFWIRNNLETLADKGNAPGDVDRITKVVNPATDSYQARQDNFATAFGAFS
jgi:putative chitinase